MAEPMLVDSQAYPTEPVDEEWLVESMAKKTAILNAVATSFRLHPTFIHTDDEMWNGLLVGQKDADRRWVRRHYFYGGRSAMRNIAEALIAADAPLPKRVLDFPSSHGRVTRFLRTAFPGAELFVGDVDHSAVDFCSAAFGAIPVYSDRDLSRVILPHACDLIWCSSLITHLPEMACCKLIDMFVDALAPGGVAGITTCGRGMDHMQRNVFPTIAEEIYDKIYKEYEERGFGYHDYPGWTGFGMTFMDLRWIQSALFRRRDVLILSFRENAWHGWQDILWLVKKPVSASYDWGRA